MKNKLLIVIVLAGWVVAGCGGSGGSGSSDKTCHLCFTNNQSTAIYGIGYRESGTDAWHRIYFDGPVDQGEGFGYEDGVLEEDPPGEGFYDVMCFDTSGDPVRQWMDVTYAKEDYGMVVNDVAGESLFGPVDTACIPNGVIFYDLSKCETFSGYCVEGAMCDSDHFPWYAWGCQTSNCCLPETSSCAALGGICMRIENIQDCHDMGYKAANSLDCPGSPLTTICCMPVD